MDWPGNPCLQQLQLTPTSSDPLVAALFGIECQRLGRAVLLLARRDDFPRLEIGNANWLEAIEQEIVVPLAPAEFFRRAICVSIDEARSALAALGYELPVAISSRESLAEELKVWRRLRDNEITQFDAIVTRGVGP